MANAQRSSFQVKDVSYEHIWFVTTLKGHTTDITGMDFAQDGKRLVTVSSDRAAFLWDVRVRVVNFVCSTYFQLKSFSGVSYINEA